MNPRLSPNAKKGREEHVLETRHVFLVPPTWNNAFFEEKQKVPRESASLHSQMPKADQRKGPIT
jgi:hypothetical protein